MDISYKYRLLPSSRQHEKLRNILEDQRILYNAALEERTGAYRLTGKNPSLYNQCKGLAEWRQSDPEAAETPQYFQRWTLIRLDVACHAFVNKVKRREKAGSPRYRSKTRWESFGFAAPVNGKFGAKFDGKRLRWRGLPGGLRVHLHRPLPVDADIRAFSITRDLKGWSISFQLKFPDVEKRPIEKVVGIDVGLDVFAYQSDDVVIANPRVARRNEKEIRRRQRALSRCKRGSQRRKKIKRKVTVLHKKISNTRATFLHQQSAKLARNYDMIAVEDLKVAKMIRNPTYSRSIADVSWSKFFGYLSYKAEGAGTTLIKVNPRNTSKICSGCRELVPKTITVRTHSCPYCGLVINRDYNASLNILHDGLKILQAVVGLVGRNGNVVERRSV